MRTVLSTLLLLAAGLSWSMPVRAGILVEDVKGTVQQPSAPLGSPAAPRLAGAPDGVSDAR